MCLLSTGQRVVPVSYGVPQLVWIWDGGWWTGELLSVSCTGQHSKPVRDCRNYGEVVQNNMLLCQYSCAWMKIWSLLELKQKKTTAEQGFACITLGLVSFPIVFWLRRIICYCTHSNYITTISVFLFAKTLGRWVCALRFWYPSNYFCANKTNDNVSLDNTVFFFCSEPPSEITEKPNLTWLDAAQVSVMYCSIFSLVLVTTFTMMNCCKSFCFQVLLFCSWNFSHVDCLGGGRTSHAHKGD